MNGETINTIGIILFCSLMLLGAFLKFTDYIKLKRTPFQRFKPGTKVWFVDLHESSPKSDYYSIKCLPVDEFITINKGVYYFSIKYCDYLVTEKEMFLKVEDVIKHLESLKSESKNI